MSERFIPIGFNPEAPKPDTVRGGLSVGEAGLTPQPETSYATSGEIFMPESNGEFPPDRKPTLPTETSVGRNEIRVGNIIVPPVTNIEDPAQQAFAIKFQEKMAESSFSLADEEKWPTEELKKEYRRLNGVTIGAAARLRAALGLSQPEKPTADAQPYNLLIINELQRRGVDVAPLLQEKAAMEQAAEASLMRPGGSAPFPPGGEESSAQAALRAMGIPPQFLSQAQQIQEAERQRATGSYGEYSQGLEPRGRRNWDDPEESVDFIESNPGFQQFMQENLGYDRDMARNLWRSALAQGYINPDQEREAYQAESRARLRRPEGREDRNIGNLNEFLEEVIKKSDPMWGREGKFHLVNIKENGETEINQENFMRWIRDRMNYFHNESPNEEFSMYQKVRLQRFYRDISVKDMLENPERYFRDTEGRQYNKLADQIRREVWQFEDSRSTNIEYELLMGDDTKLPDVITKRFYYNFLTRTIWGKSLLAHTLTMPEKFDSNPTTFVGGTAIEPESQPELDARVGIALNTAFLAYYNISDLDKLRELLGANAPLLNQRSIKAVIETLAEEEGVDPAKFIQDTGGLAEKIFAGGTLSDKELIDFINIYSSPEKPARMIQVVRELIGRSVQYKFRTQASNGNDAPENVEEEEGEVLNTIDAKYAEQFAFLKTRFLGAGWRNDLAANANDAGVKPGKLKPYRMKQASPNRGGAIGNPYSIHMLKSFMVDFLNGSRTETWRLKPDGTVYEDDLGNKHRYTPLQLMEEMEKKGLDDRAVRDLSEMLIFPENTMRQYAQNHVVRGFQMFHDVTEGNEIDWNAFVTIDPIAGVRFNRKKFEEEVKENFFKKMRYAWSTYGQLDFSQKIRTRVEVLDERGMPKKDNKGATIEEWKDQELALSLFGYEILDIPFFWKKDERGRVEKDEHGRNKIDFDIVNDNKARLWKQVALGRLAAEFYAHRDWNSTDPRYNEIFYMQVIDALKLIPGGIMGSEFDLTSAKQTGSFYSDEDLKWLQRKSKTEDWRLYRNMVLKDIFMGSGLGLRKALKIFFDALIER